MEIITCKFCNRSFRKTSNGQKYCSEHCRLEAKKILRREREWKDHLAYEKRKEANEDAQRKKEGIVSIGEIMKAAKKEGLQYGEYCLKHHLY